MKNLKKQECHLKIEEMKSVQLIPEERKIGLVLECPVMKRLNSAMIVKQRKEVQIKKEMLETEES